MTNTCKNESSHCVLTKRIVVDDDDYDNYRDDDDDDDDNGDDDEDDNEDDNENDFWKNNRKRIPYHTSSPMTAINLPLSSILIYNRVSLWISNST